MNSLYSSFQKYPASTWTSFILRLWIKTDPVKHGCWIWWEINMMSCRCLSLSLFPLQPRDRNRVLRTLRGFSNHSCGHHLHLSPVLVLQPQCELCWRNICLFPATAVFGHGHHWSGLRHVPAWPGTCLVTMGQHGKDRIILIQPWFPALTLDLTHQHEPPWGSGLLAEAQCHPWVGLALGCCRAGLWPRRSWTCCLVYHPQLLAPCALGSSCCLPWTF